MDKQNNKSIMGVSESKEREKGAEYLAKETVAETFPDLRRKTDIQIQEM